MSNKVLLNYSKKQETARNQMNGTVVLTTGRSGRVREAGWIAEETFSVIAQIEAAKRFNGTAISVVWLGENVIFVKSEHNWNSNNRWSETDAMQSDEVDALLPAW
jgi:hypothetical protein